jgi:hypothetical protein
MVRAERTGGYRFHHFWCQGLFKSGWWHFKFHVMPPRNDGKSNWKTSNWICGKFEQNTCAPRGGNDDDDDWSDVDCGSLGGGVRLWARGTSCAMARAVYLSFVANGDASGWYCSGSASSGSCNYTSPGRARGGIGGYDSTVSWHP